MTRCGGTLHAALLTGAVLAVASCGAPKPFPAVGEIVVASGGFSGSSSTQIFSDGTVIQSTAVPGGVPIRTVQHAMPDVYRKAASVLAAEGLATRRALKPQAEPCLDYGTDQVSATPPVAGFDRVSAACPDPALSTLMAHVLATLARP